jgi:hypothetical protein
LPEGIGLPWQYSHLDIKPMPQTQSLYEIKKLQAVYISESQKFIDALQAGAELSDLLAIRKSLKNVTEELARRANARADSMLHMPQTQTPQK